MAARADDEVISAGPLQFRTKTPFAGLVSENEGRTACLNSRRHGTFADTSRPLEVQFMSHHPPPGTALIVIDVQRAFDEWEAAGKRRNNPEAVDRIVELLAAFRGSSIPIFHIRHQGTGPNSSFRPGGTGYAVKDEAREMAGEPVIVKRVNSAFIGTDLEARLRGADIKTLVICGATTNHCVETTARMAGNLGFDARLVRDATWTFDRTGPDGDRYSAEDIHAMTLANLNGEFARIVSAAEVIATLKGA
jgi:nicotinamidase-related amidase